MADAEDLYRPTEEHEAFRAAVREVCDAKVAPRKLPKYDQVYPIEVVASWPDPKGKKAHETVVTVDVKPSDVQASRNLPSTATSITPFKSAPEKPSVFLAM